MVFPSRDFSSIFPAALRKQSLAVDSETGIVSVGPSIAQTELLNLLADPEAIVDISALDDTNRLPTSIAAKEIVFTGKAFVSSTVEKARAFRIQAEDKISFSRLRTAGDLILETKGELRASELKRCANFNAFSPAHADLSQLEEAQNFDLIAETASLSQFRSGLDVNLSTDDKNLKLLNFRKAASLSLWSAENALLPACEDLGGLYMPKGKSLCAHELASIDCLIAPEMMTLHAPKLRVLETVDQSPLEQINMALWNSALRKGNFILDMEDGKISLLGREDLELVEEKMRLYEIAFKNTAAKASCAPAPRPF